MPRTSTLHLLVDITAHGYGHLAQTAPVVNELARRIPDLRITVRSAAPHEVVQRRFSCKITHIQTALDFGMKMVNAIEIQAEESLAAYRAYHAGWEARVSMAAQEISSLKPDLLLANVPYLSLAAARAAGIRAAAMCSLNWADVFRHYFPDETEIHSQILAAYNSAEAFLKLQPAMPMPDLRNGRSIGPIAQKGTRRREELVARCGAGSQDRIVLVAMGGLAYRLPVESWPIAQGLRWIVPQEWGVSRPDMIAFETLAMPFIDALASCDALLTKPGYGSFAEAAGMSIPVLYVSRGDWPEQPYLVQWLAQHSACREVSAIQLHTGEFLSLLEEVRRQPQPPYPLLSGAGEVADVLMAML